MRTHRGLLLSALLLAASCSTGGAGALASLDPIPAVAEPAAPGFDVAPPDTTPEPVEDVALTPTTLASRDDPLDALRTEVLAPLGYCVDEAPLPLNECATLAGETFGGTVYVVTTVRSRPVFVRLATADDGGLVVDGEHTSGIGTPPPWASSFVDYGPGRAYSPYDLVDREMSGRGTPYTGYNCSRDPSGFWCVQYELVDATHVRVQVLAPDPSQDEVWDVEYDPETERYGWIDGSNIPTPGRFG